MSNAFKPIPVRDSVFDNGRCSTRSRPSTGFYDNIQKAPAPKNTESDFRLKITEGFLARRKSRCHYDSDNLTQLQELQENANTIANSYSQDYNEPDGFGQCFPSRRVPVV